MKRVNPPKSQLEISSGQLNVIDRSTQIRRDDDKIKDYTNGLYDIDYAIQYYIKNVIKPTVVENGKIISVPVMYGAPEQWTSIRKMAFLRDNKGKMIVPLIAYSQTGGSKNTEMPVDKLDANNPHLFYTYGQRWSKKNQYDNFNALVGKTPSYELFRIIVPDYLNLNYEVIVWTTYMEQMNKIIEAIVYSEGAYWGEEERGKFRTTISDYSKTVEVAQGTDRYCQTTMTLTVYGYIIPDTINKHLSMKSGNQKIFSNSKILFTAEVDKTFDQFAVGTSPKTSAIVASGITPTVGKSTIDSEIAAYTEFARNNYQLIGTNVNTTGPYTTITFPSASLASVPTSMSSLTKEDFLLFVNGQNIDRSYYQIPYEYNGDIYVQVINTNLTFDITSDDNIVIYGKFTAPQATSVINNDPRLKAKQMLFRDVTLEGHTIITGSLTIVGDTESTGSITLTTGSQLITDTGQIGFSGSLDLGEF